MPSSQKVDEYLAELPDWQREFLGTFRKLIHNVEPEVQEDVKWSVPVFSANKKMVCAMSAFKEHIKFNFFEGALLKDTHKLFNNGFDSKKHRSIDFREGEKIDEKKLANLLAEALKG